MEKEEEIVRVEGVKDIFGTLWGLGEHYSWYRRGVVRDWCHLREQRSQTWWEFHAAVEGMFLTSIAGGLW